MGFSTAEAISRRSILSSFSVRIGNSPASMQKGRYSFFISWLRSKAGQHSVCQAGTKSTRAGAVAVLPHMARERTGNGEFRKNDHCRLQPLRANGLFLEYFKAGDFPPQRTMCSFKRQSFKIRCISCETSVANRRISKNSANSYRDKRKLYQGSV